jgi:hypothetical protein
MKRRSVILPFIASVALVLLVLLNQPSPTTMAGGLPCFLCHGSQFQGSDLAPSVADTKLTDEEILKQIRSPRGLMPAFPEFANQSIVDWIRSNPTGQPTAALAPEQRSAALATLAAVAATRATAFAQIAQGEAGATPTPSPSPVAPASTPTWSGAALSASSSSTIKPASVSASSAPISAFAAIGGLLAAIGGAWWVWQRRKEAG